MAKRKEKSTNTTTKRKILSLPIPTEFKSSRDLLCKVIVPRTKAQKDTFDAFEKNHLVLHGSPGSGKTFIATYLGLDHMKEHREINRIIFIRSLVQTFDIGFLPGGITPEDNGKLEPFISPYKAIVNDLCGKGAWNALYGTKIEFISTSALRGTTFDNAIVIVDECQNLDFHSLDTVITRLGASSKLILCGDYKQSDLKKSSDKVAIIKFMKILKKIPFFKFINFTHDDIVRSKLVKDYIIAKENLEDQEEE